MLAVLRTNRSSSRQRSATRTIAGCTAARSLAMRSMTGATRSPYSRAKRSASTSRSRASPAARRIFRSRFFTQRALFARQPIAIQLERGDGSPRGDAEPMDVLDIVLGQVGRQRQAGATTAVAAVRAIGAQHHRRCFRADAFDPFSAGCHGGRSHVGGGMASNVAEPPATTERLAFGSTPATPGKPSSHYR